MRSKDSKHNSHHRKLYAFTIHIHWQQYAHNWTISRQRHATLSELIDGISKQTSIYVFYRRRNLRPRWSTTKVHASQLPYFDHKKKCVYRSQKWNITPLEIQHKIHSTFYFLSTVPLKATYHTPSSSCAFAMRKFHSHLPNPEQTADHHSEDETKQSQTTNNNPQNKPKKHMIDAVCM